MKTNMFNEPIAEPGDSYDDVAVAVMERRGLEELPEFWGAFIDPPEDGKWSGELRTDAGDGMPVPFHDFPSEEDALDWLVVTMKLDLSDIDKA